MRSYLFSSESVTEGHPDKVCDRVSDGVLDACLAQDPRSRVACETATTTGIVFVAGEITTKARFDVQEVAREALREIGYVDEAYGISADTCSIVSAIHKQSPDIALGVDREGAGDQGMMFGYACRETPDLMPLPIMLAHRLCRRLAEVRRRKILGFVRPDGKAQVTVRYEDNVPVEVATVVVSTQHDPVPRKRLVDGVRADVINYIIPRGLRAKKMKVHVNPTGRFVVGGPHGDSGLTGRKIIVDTYGGSCPHGGGAFSGKDPSKVDRSATYACRWIAKNVVAAGLADRCQVQVAYAIGVRDPVSVMVETFGTGVAPDEDLDRAVREVFDLTPRGIIEALKLRRPVYRKTAAYGHFGRSGPEFTWERTDRAAALRRALGA